MIARRQFFGGLMASGAAAALAGRARASSAPVTPEQRMGRLLAGIERIESVRAAKALQNSLAQYVHHGLWQEAGALFAANGTLEWDGATLSGPAAIAGHLREVLGGGQDGLPPGAAHSQWLLAPVVTLSPDGQRVHGRWHEVRLANAPVAWGASIMIVDYAREGGRWKIARLANHPIFAGPYDTGWRNVVADLPVVPYSYTPDDAGRPETQQDATPQPLSRLGEAWQRIGALAAEDAARNLQNIYGYYVDRKMWDDVADLFAPGGVLVIEGVGRFEGRAQIRQALERDGPAGLRHGELNDHPQLNTTVAVAPSGLEARVRGLDLGMIGINGGDAFWTLATFDNRFVQRDGVWMIAEMRLYPELKADYYRSMEPPAAAGSGPARRIAAFPVNPATGAQVRYPGGLEPVAHLLGGGAAPANAGQLADAETALARAAAFDPIENISTSVGNYLNDSKWEEMSRLFTLKGWRRSPQAGYYQGRERILQMQTRRNGPMRTPRASIPLHLRIQPVIHVAPDGRSARLRSRLLQFNSGYGSAGSMTAGMYECRLELEDGLWKFELDDIDHIWRTNSYSEGWARLAEGSGEAASRSPAALLQAMPPDLPLQGRAYPAFPGIAGIWFHYRNPVSGRAPPDLLPE